MTRTERKYTTAAILFFTAAALHLPIALLAFGSYGVPMIATAILWALLGLGLMRNWRWCGFLAFLAALGGILAALAGALDSFGAVAGLFWLVVTINLLATLILFGLLWAAQHVGRAV